MKFYYKFEPLLDLRSNIYNILAFTGGRGSGKTQHTIRGILVDVLKGKRNYCFFRETKDTLNMSIKKDVDELIYSDFLFRGFSVFSDKITHTNGSVIYFKGLKEINFQSIQNLKGFASAIDVFIIDEGQAISEVVLKTLLETIRGFNSKFIIMYNRVKSDLPVEKQLFLDYNNMTAPIGTYFIETSYLELLPLGLIPDFFLKRAELVKKYKPHDYSTSYLNHVDNFDDLRVIKSFSNDNIKPLFYQDNLDLHISCDFNVDPMAWVFFHKTQDTLYFFDELVQEHTTTPLCANEIIRRYPLHSGNIILNGDASGQAKNVAHANPDINNFILIKNILEKHYRHEVKIEIRKGNPHKKNRYLAFNELVKDLNGKIRVYFDPRCTKCLYNIQNVFYKVGTSQVDEPTPNQIRADINKKFLIHPLDAFTYPAEYYFPIH